VLSLNHLASGYGIAVYFASPIRYSLVMDPDVPLLENLVSARNFALPTGSDASLETKILWPDADCGPWQVGVTWAWQSEGRFACVGISIGPQPGGEMQPLTSLDFRALRLLDIQERARPALKQELMRIVGSGSARSAPAVEALSGESLDPAETEERMAEMWDDATAKRPPGRPALYGDGHWRRVADTYIEAIRLGSHRPTGIVADKFNVDPSTAAKWVARCRRPPLLLLGQTTKRRAGGVLPVPDTDERGTHGKTD
jgi:hypothetical protein